MSSESEGKYKKKYSHDVDNHETCRRNSTTKSCSTTQIVQI